MPLKHGTSAALERRMDLASFFCMIGRHGPAVVLAVLAALCLLAGLVVYWRMKRGRKRREATDAAGDDGDAGAAVEADRRPGLRARTGDQRRMSPPESTDIGSSGIKEDLLHRHVSVRKRRFITSENNPGLNSPPVEHVQEPAIRETEERRDWTTQAEREAEPVHRLVEEVQGAEREEPEGIQDGDDVTHGKELEDQPLENTGHYDHEEEEEEEEVVPQLDQMDPSTPEEPADWTRAPHLDQGTPESMMDNQETADDGHEDEDMCNEEVVRPKESDQEVQLSHETAELISSIPVLSPSPPEQEASLVSVDPSPDFPTHEESLDLDCQQPMHEEIEEDKEEEGEEPPAPVLDELAEKVVDLCTTPQNGQLENLDTVESKPAEDQESEERLDDCRDPVDADSAETAVEVTCADLLSVRQTLDHLDISKEFSGLGFDVGSCSNNNNTFVTSEETFVTVTHQEIQSMTQQIRLPPFTLRDADFSTGVGAESGISSMTVTPDLQEEEFGKMVEDMDCDPQCGEAELRLYADDITASVYIVDSADLSFGPSEPHTQVLAANEDMFGHEIEERYHQALEAAMLEMSANMVTERIEVVAVKASKKEKDEEEEKEEEYERTEISIMEATMDHNEWITEGSYQVLPWMNGSSFSQDHSKPPAGVSCIDTDSAPFGDVISTPPPAFDGFQQVVAVPSPAKVNVTFRIHYVTHSPYQTVAITGNQAALGNWAEFVPLERAGGGHWAAAVCLPAHSRVEWKFVLLEEGQVSRWEECGNRELDTGAGGELTVHKWWGLL